MEPPVPFERLLSQWNDASPAPGGGSNELDTSAIAAPVTVAWRMAWAAALALHQGRHRIASTAAGPGGQRLDERLIPGVGGSVARDRFIVLGSGPSTARPPRTSAARIGDRG